MHIQNNNSKPLVWAVGFVVAIRWIINIKVLFGFSGDMSGLLFGIGVNTAIDVTMIAIMWALTHERVHGVLKGVLGVLIPCLIGLNVFIGSDNISAGYRAANAKKEAAQSSVKVANGANDRIAAAQASLAKCASDFWNDKEAKKSCVTMNQAAIADAQKEKASIVKVDTKAQKRTQFWDDWAKIYNANKEPTDQLTGGELNNIFGVVLLTFYEIGVLVITLIIFLMNKFANEDLGGGNPDPKKKEPLPKLENKTNAKAYSVNLGSYGTNVQGKGHAASLSLRTANSMPVVKQAPTDSSITDTSMTGIKNNVIAFKKKEPLTNAPTDTSITGITTGIEDNAEDERNALLMALDKVQNAKVNDVVACPVCSASFTKKNNWHKYCSHSRKPRQDGFNCAEIAARIINPDRQRFAKQHLKK